MGALTVVFLKELQKFNDGVYNNLILHPEVIMNEVDDPFKAHYGNRDVINYLVQYQTAPRPQLILDPTKLVESPPSLSGANHHGQVSGTGTYQDNSAPYTDPQGIVHPQPSLPFPVRYIFNFRFEGNVWLIINATAIATK